MSSLNCFFFSVLQSMIDVCIENAGELLRSNFGKEVLYEVVKLFIADCYAHDGIA